MSFVEERARIYFYDLHDNKVNQKYGDNLPYSFHLEMVAKQAEKFQKYIPSDNPYHSNVWVGIYGHDSIEDARLTYNDIKTQYGTEVAEIIYLCTEDKGRNRSDRKSDKFYEELKTNPEAVFVKLCDLIANVKFSLLTNSSMFKNYRMEYSEKIRPHLYTVNFEDMFTYLDKLFQLD